MVYYIVTKESKIMDIKLHTYCIYVDNKIHNAFISKLYWLGTCIHIVWQFPPMAERQNAPPILLLKS